MWNDEYEYRRTSGGCKVLVDLLVLAFALAVVALTILAGLS